MTMTRRNLLAGAGAAAASALLSRAAGAQSFPFTPNQRYPDPAVQILDPSFAKYRIYSSTVEQVATGMRWAEGPAYFPEGGYLLFSDIPNNRIMKFDEKTNQTTRLPRQRQLRQRQCARPPGPPRHLRAFGHPPHHPHREGRQDHRAGRQVRRQAAERAERHRGEVRRHHLVHRSLVRHQRRVGRQEGKAGAGDHQRLPPRPRTASSPPSSPTSSIRTAWRSRRTKRSSMSWNGRARRTAASGVMTSRTMARSATGPR